MWQRERGVWHVKDLGSTNGLLVNGVRVKQADLRDNDELSFGGANLLEVGQTISGDIGSDFRYRFSTVEVKRLELSSPTSTDNASTSTNKIDGTSSCVSLPRGSSSTLPNRPPKSKVTNAMYDNEQSRARISAYNQLQVCGKL